MKKYFILALLIVVAVLIFNGCKADEKRDRCFVGTYMIGDDGSKEDCVTENVKSNICGVQYIRTNGSFDLLEYPRLIYITDRKDLEAYYNCFSGVYFLDNPETVYSDTTIGWLEASEKYDNEYFEDHDLYMAVLEEGSGSVRHSVDGIDNGAVIIRPILPENGTDDMAEWHIFIEVNRAAVLDGIKMGEKIYSDVYTPEQAEEIFLSALEIQALNYLKELEITGVTPQKIIKTDYGTVKIRDITDPLGYDPGYDSSPVWQFDFEYQERAFSVYMCDAMFVFATEGLE